MNHCRHFIAGIALLVLLVWDGATVTHAQLLYVPRTTDTNIVRGRIDPLPGFAARSMAVLVGNTNFAAAEWTPFATNVTIDLGPGGGFKDIWFGFRGRHTRGLPAGRDKDAEIVRPWKIFVDATPMEFHLTAPTNAVVTSPVVQIEGYWTKPVLRVFCDLTNAKGVARLEDTYVTGRTTHRGVIMESTNWIACFDVPLAHGTNLFSMKAEDRKERLWTNTFQLVFNLALLTNPPTVKLLWPRDGEIIGGESVTLQGMTSDPSGTISAVITPDVGESENVEGLIERDGLFWLDDIPLTGTNHTLKITMIDAAGNTTKTNITLIRSSLRITIDPVPDDELAKPTATVTGFISSKDHTVWVNGVRSTVGANGKWTATNVPVPSGGMATFHTTAIPNSVNGGNGIAPPPAEGVLKPTNLFQRNPTAPAAPSR